MITHHAPKTINRKRDEEMVTEIRNTVVRKEAHHFGIDDDRLEEMEL